MAGIGFELRHMLRKNTLLSLVQAYAYASVIGSGPWVFSIVGILLIVFIPAVIAMFISFGGFFIVQPNEARVLVLFGKYIGSVRDAGFFFANPFVTKKHVSLRNHNFNSERIKVNDLDGNPIEIGAVVVYRVTDSARALFDVENYEQFVGFPARERRLRVELRAEF